MKLTSLILLIVLSISAITDIHGRRIPNYIIIAAAMAGTLTCGITFIIRFTSITLLFLLIGGHRLGSGDKKLIALLFGFYGFSDTFLFILLIGFILFVLIYIPKRNFKTKHPLAPFILGGFICVELLPL